MHLSLCNPNLYIGGGKMLNTYGKGGVQVTYMTSKY